MRSIVQIILLTLICQLQVAGKKNEILIKIDKTAVTKSEFERIYRKNNQNLMNKADVTSPEDYLNLFINFKLKVVEAINLKMDTSQHFIQELAGYRKELAAPYLTNMEYDDDMIKELYNRTLKQINTGHILLTADQNASRTELQKVYDKALSIRQEIIEGKDFETAAVQYSEDPSVTVNHGNLGYFSAFQMVTPFENAAFNTPVGTISKPIQTSYGYHLIKVFDIRDNPGEVKVAHIMKVFPDEDDLFSKKDKKEQIDSLYSSLLKGADFAELARLNSEDERSAVEGGEMPWFSSTQMIPEFAQPAFQLDKPGEFTKPIETPFGYHIIKKLDSREPPTFEESRHDIEERIKKDPDRTKSSREAFIEKLKNEYNFILNDQNVNLTANDSIPADNEKNIPLFTLNKKNYTLNDLSQYVEKSYLPPGRVAEYIDEWSSAEIIQLEEDQLENKYPEFKLLIQEYHDGLLLFNIMEDKIWNYAAYDSTGLEKFYNNNRDIFIWGERFDGVIISCKDQQTKEEAEKLFNEGKNSAEIKNILNKKAVNIEIRQGVWEKGDNPVVDYYCWKGAEPSAFSEKLTFIKGEIIPPAPKTFEESKGLYISEYQNYLEDEWIKQLRKKYRVKVNKRLLKSIPHV